MYCLVSTFSKSFDEIGLIYFVPDFLEGEIKKGLIIEVPFGDKIELAVILDINISIGDIESSKIKSIISIKNKNIFLTEFQISLVRWMSKYYITPIHNILQLFFPKNLIEKIGKEKLTDFTTKHNYIYTYNSDIIFSNDQEKAYSELNDNSYSQFLLYGVTGSGKTELYIQLIKQNLDNNKQSLLLIPEIILSNQIAEKIKYVFGDDVIIINSTVSQAQRTKYWLDIKTEKAKIIISTRSGLFYPYSNLGLIIVDEEHDNSYNSDQSPRFHSLDIIEYFSSKLNIKTILASGTPSVTSMYKSVTGKYKGINLLNKYKKPTIK